MKKRKNKYLDFHSDFNSLIIIQNKIENKILFIF